MCALVTTEFFEFAEQQMTIKNPYVAEKTRLEEVNHDVREDVFLDAVFGKESRMTHDDWCASVVENATWIFDSDKLRKKIFETAGIKYEGTKS